MLYGHECGAFMRKVPFLTTALLVLSLYWIQNSASTSSLLCGQIP